MEKTTEKEQVLNARTGEKIVRVEIIDNGHAIKIYSVLESKDETMQISLSNEEIKSEVNEKGFEEMFPIVEVDKISLEDEFMKHEPENKNQKRVKEAIIKDIKEGLKNNLEIDMLEIDIKNIWNLLGKIIGDTLFI